MLKLKGQTELGTWVKFNITQIEGLAGDYIAVAIHSDYTVFINPSTIQLVDDLQSSDALIKASGKAMLDEIRGKLRHVYMIVDQMRSDRGYSEDEVDAILNEMEAKL